MAKKIQNTYIIAGIMILILATTACGTFQVGLEAPAPVQDTELISENQEPELELTALEESENQTENEPALEPAEKIPETPTEILVTAWLGHIANLPEGSQYDDLVILSPQGTGEFGLTGATPEIEAEIRTLRDADGPSEYVHLWGVLSCEVEDYNGCQLLVNKLQYGANYAEEDIEDWFGIITNSSFNGGPSHVFELSDEYPMWYSIYASQDESLQAQIESLRDTGAIVKVSGKLLVGFPDVNGTRIEVSELEVIEAGTIEQPALDETFDPIADWQIFVSDRYNYQIKYPQHATISLFGPARFSSDDIPLGLTEEQYMDQLMKEYTDQLCVQIEYSLGFIYISAPPNNDEDFYVHCGNPAFGAGETIAKDENAFIGADLYQANGYEFIGNMPTKGETLDLHNEIFWIYLEDGTRIAYGATSRADATYEDYLMKTKEILLRILKTYEAMP